MKTERDIENLFWAREAFRFSARAAVWDNGSWWKFLFVYAVQWWGLTHVSVNLHRQSTQGCKYRDKFNDIFRSCLSEPSPLASARLLCILSSSSITGRHFAVIAMSVRAGYRHLLRTCKQAFNGDPAAFNVAIQEIRSQVYSKTSVTDPDQKRKALSSNQMSTFPSSIFPRSPHRPVLRSGRIFETQCCSGILNTRWELRYVGSTIAVLSRLQISRLTHCRDSADSPPRQGPRPV